MAEIFDIWNQAHYQRLVTVSLQTRIEQENPIVRQMVTMVPTTEDKIRLDRAEIKAFGYARPKAFGASPPIYVPKLRYSETEVELLPIHEKSPIDERLFRKLHSDDPRVRMRAGADAVLRGTALQMRNEVGWDVLTMNAILTGQLNVLFEDERDAGFNIDYGYDPTHFVSVGTPWSDLAHSTPITEIRAVQLMLANSAGDYAIHFWLTTNTMRGIIESDQAKELLTGFDGRPQYIPVLSDVGSRLYEGDRVVWHVSDSGYRDETYDRGLNAHTKYLPDGKIVATTADPFEGEPLIEVFDGMVVVPVGPTTPPSFRQGAQNWLVVDMNTAVSDYHFASTRIPRINRPECIAVIDTKGVPA